MRDNTVNEYTLIDGSASIKGELGLLTTKEYTAPLSKKGTTESLKTALYELLNYAETVKELEEENAELQAQIKKKDNQIKAMQETESGETAELKARLVELEKVLEKLACLGNGDFYGNSEGNVIAREALKKLNQPDKG